MQKQNPHFALFLGDWIYSDHPWYPQDSVAFYHSRYRNVFQDTFVQNFVSTIPSAWICILPSFSSQQIEK
jgi:phosphodiesterase/alkaline phosphatase D-like protein